MLCQPTRLSRFATRLFGVFLLLTAVAAAQAAEAPKAGLQLASEDPIVATVNGQAIHKSDVMRVKASLGQQAAQIPIEQIYPQILRKLVDVDLLADAARTDKLQDDPDVKADLLLSENNVLANKYVQRFAAKAATDQELKAAYQKLIKEHTADEEIHARHILLTSEADAKDVIAQLDKGADFAKLANEKSQDKSGDGGDLGWFTKDKMVPEFADAAFKLKKGEYTKTPVKSQFGWHVIQVLDRRTAKPPAFDEVKEQLTQQLDNQAVTAKIKDLRAAAKVEEFNLDGTPKAAETAAPPATTPAPAPAKP